MFGKIIAFVLLLTFSPIALAEDTASPKIPGTFTILDQGEITPFPGVLFDARATSYLLTLPNYYEQKYSIECDFLLSQELAKKELEIETMTIRLETQAQELAVTIEQKDLEIDSLQAALKRKQLIDPWVWGIIGAVVGSSVTIGVVKATQ